MTERQLLSKLIKQLKEAYPQSWFYKIPDSYGGKKKPFDLLCVHEGKSYAFEAKVDNEKLKPHQEKALREFDAAGGFAGVIRFSYSESFGLDELSVYDISTGRAFAFMHADTFFDALKAFM